MNDIIAGFAGGTFGSIIAHPIDTIRVRYQTKNYTNIVHTIKDTYKKGGFKGFYRGISYPLVGISIEKAAVFTSFNYFKNKHYFSNENMNILFAGFGSGITTSFIVTPIESLKTQYQFSMNLKSLGLKDILYYARTGYLATTLRESIGYSVYFLTYQILENKYNKTSMIPFYGAMSALTSWGIIYPLDLIKNLKVTNPTYTYYEIINNIKNKNGIIGFYKGFWLAQLRALPYHAAVWTGYKYTLQFLESMK